MGNCLVTKLKGVVNNDRLLKVGELIVHINSDGDSNIPLTIRNSKEMTLTVIGNTGKMARTLEELVTAPQSTITVPAGELATIYFSKAEYDVKVTEKYTLIIMNSSSSSSFIPIASFNLSDLSYSTELQQMQVRNSLVEGDIKYLENCKLLASLSTMDAPYIHGDIGVLADKSALTQLIMRGTDITGDISSLANKPALNIAYLYNGSTYGNIDTLGTDTALTQLMLSINGNYTGSIEGFVQGQINNGRANLTNPMFVDCIVDLVSFGGEKHNTDYSIQGLVWTSNNGQVSTITVYSGGRTEEACTTIFAKGASAEQIAAWQQAGKTVVNCD